MFELTDSKKSELEDRGKTSYDQAVDHLARWFDLIFVLWLVISVVLFLGQFQPFIEPFLNSLGI